MAKLVILLIIGLSAYLVFKILSKVFKLNTSRKDKYKVIDNRKKTLSENFYYFKDVIVKKLVRFVILNDASYEDLKMKLSRIGSDKAPQDVKAEKIFYSLGACIFAFFMSRININLGLVSCILIPIAWITPEREINEKINKINAKIEDDFDSFYSLVYYSFVRSTNVFLRDIVLDYLPNASEEFAHELRIFLDNEQEGEKVALRRLRQRVPLRYIIRFCDLMEKRIEGRDNIESMTYLKTELFNNKLERLERKLDKRVKKALAVQDLIVIPLGLLFLVSWFFQFKEALELFSM